MSTHGRCAVVGAGLLGLAAARSMARRGWDTVVYEAAPAPGHDRSGSKGGARIFRLGYPDPRDVEMALLARTAWEDLEAATGTRLLFVTGQLTFGPGLQDVEEALRTAGVATKPLSRTEVARRFPGIDPPTAVLFEPDSGVLAAGRCLDALQATTTTPFHLRVDHEVTALEDDPEDGGVAVVLAGRPAERADVVVDCAGYRTLALLDGAGATGPGPGSGPSLPQVAYFAPRDTTAPRPPVFIEWGPDMIYGLPVPATPGGPHAGLYKVSHHTAGPPFDPADLSPFGDDPVLLARLVDAARRLLPGLDPEPVATERCVYDNSGDDDFVLDRVGRVVVGCGTSGHAFKFGPLLGELLADVAEGLTPAVDVSRFSLTRFARSALSARSVPSDRSDPRTRLPR